MNWVYWIAGGAATGALLCLVWKPLMWYRAQILDFIFVELPKRRK